MSDLPEDLVEEILCRIPATYVKKLRSTCKQWNNLFNNRRFTRNHFDKAAKQFLSFILKEFRVCSMTINLHGIVPSIEVKSELNQLDPLYNNSYQFLISEVFHCDGLLLCISEYCTRIVVWNPCTGQKGGSNQDMVTSLATTMLLDLTKTANPAITATKSCAVRVMTPTKDLKSMRLTLIHGGFLMSLVTAP